MRCKLKSDAELLKKFGLEKGGRVQEAIDYAVIDACDPFVPEFQGVYPSGNESFGLKDSVYIPEPGKIKWPGPYAHYVYNGAVYGPNIPIRGLEGEVIGFRSHPGMKKEPTGKEMVYSKPGATSFWVEAAKAKSLKDIVKEANDVAKRRTD